MRITIHVEGETMGDVLGQLRTLVPVVERATAVDLATVVAPVLASEDVEPETLEAKDELADLGKMKDEALALLQKAFTTNKAGVQAIQKRFGVKKFADVPAMLAAELLREAKAL